MPHKRTLLIREKIFTKENLLPLLRYLIEQYEVADEKHLRSRFRMQITEDLTHEQTLHSPSVDLDGLLSNRIVRLRLLIACGKVSRELDFEIQHVDVYGYSELTLEGDESWVNATYLESKRLLDNVTPQYSLIRRKPYLIALGVCLSSGILLRRLLFLYLSATGQTQQVPFSLGYLMKHTLLVVAFGIMPASFIMGKLHRIYPSIELRLGPSHYWHEERNQRIMNQMISLLIIAPMVEQFLSIFIY